MRLNTKDLREGKLNGQEVWVCHYLRPDLNKKPLRAIPPTLCLVRPRTKTMYYTDSELVVLNKKGEPTTKIHSPVDNTGYRSNPGHELFVFTTEVECVAEWEHQVLIVLAMWKNRRAVALQEIDDEISKLQKLVNLQKQISGS